MIDNPLPNQVMQEKETLQNAQDFEFLCKHHAVEIAAHYKVHPDLDEYEDMHPEDQEWLQQIAENINRSDELPDLEEEKE